MQFVILEAKNLHEEDIKNLLTALKNSALFGTQAHPIPAIALTARKPRSANIPVDEDGKSSDSEQSDSEDRYQTWKVRYHALTCITAIAKCSSKLFYGYWSIFIPSSPAPLSPTIFTMILHDPSSKVRTLAANTLMTIVDGSKNFLMAADDKYKIIT